MQAIPALAQQVLGSIIGRPQQPAPTTVAPAQQTDAELLDLVEKRYRHSQTQKLPMLQVWSTCLAFYVGDQWREWNRNQRRLVVRTKIPEWRVLPVYNQIPGVIDTAATALGGTQQLPQARPDDESDPQSCEEARKSTHGLQGWAYRGEWDVTKHQTDVNRILFGCGFVHLYWNPSELAKVPVPDLLSGRTRGEYAPVGDCCTEVLTVFDVFPDPQEQWSDVSYVIIARRKPLRWFRDTFPETGKAVQPDKGDVDSAFASLLPSVDQATGLGEASGGPDEDQLATLKIYYEKPCVSYPEGRTVYVAGKTVLFRLDRLPLPHQGCKDPLPVKKVPYRYVPKRLWDKGLIEECLSPQREMNRGLGNLSELLRLYRGPKWFLPKGANVKPNSITSAPDEVIEYTGQQRPEAVPPPPLPAWLAEYPNAQREELRAVAGQHEVSEGLVPSGVQAASAIALLQQAESKRTDTPARLGKFAYQALFKHVLVVISERYREPRMLSVPSRKAAPTMVPGPDGQMVKNPAAGFAQSTAVVQPGDLSPLDVEIQLVTGIEDNDAVRTQQVNDWLGAGLFQMPLPLQLAILRDVGQGWLAEAIEEAQPQIEAMQAQQMAQQQEMQLQQAALQGGEGPSGPDPQAQMALQAQQQEGQAAQQQQQGWQQLLLQSQKLSHERQQKQADREHQLRLARLNNQARNQRPQPRN